MTILEHLVGGLRLAVSEQGCGPPVLFQHGLCADASQPAKIFPLDAFRCLTVECRGHGSSDTGPLHELGIATFTDDIASFVDARQWGPLPVGGTSTGAAIALRLAVLRPDLVSALILAKPAWLTDPAPANMRPKMMVGELLQRYGVAEARTRFEQSATAAGFADKAPDNLTALRRLFDRVPLQTTAALLTRIAADGPGVSREQVQALKIPTLVIGHERDPIHPMSVARELAALIPEARLVAITPKADDHKLYQAEFRAALRHFLTENWRNTHWVKARTRGGSCRLCG